MSLTDLSTAPIKDDVDFANLPEQMGGQYPDPPQPGTYRFKLSKLSGDHFDPIDDAVWGPRVRVKFDTNAPLVIVQAPVQFPEFAGETFQTSLSNIPRKRGKADNAPTASDWDYLNQSLGETSRPKSARDYATALMAQSNKGAEFISDVEFNWSCNDRKPARFADPNGGVAAEAQDANGSPVMGCGKRYYQKDVQKADGRYPLRITCECGAQVRAFANLTRFRPAGQ